MAALAVAAAAVYEQVQDDKFMLIMGEAGSGKTFLARALAWGIADHFGKATRATRPVEGTVAAANESGGGTTAD